MEPAPKRPRTAQPTAGPGVGGGSAEDTRGRIEAVYRAHNPAKLPQLGALIAKYGAERLLQMVTRKYCAEEEEAEREEDAAVTGGLRAALRLRASARTEADLEAFEAALRRTLDASVAQPPSSGAGAEAVLTALRQLALLLAQTGRDSEAAMQLATLGFEYRLDREVLRYVLNPKPPESGADVSPPPGKCVWMLDGALPPALLAQMQAALAPSSPFWSEHDYDVDGAPRPYFSYLHSLPDILNPPETPPTMLERLLATVHRLAVSQYPAVAEANFVEWWTHCRPHSSGHQFHFDSEDEGRGGVRHPIISTVLYLTPAGLGGPTLVTDQTLKKEALASRGWLVHPAENRLAGFDGSLLHGVVPGRGVPPGSAPDARRITFMAAFWRGPMSTTAREDRMPGSSQPMPSEATIRERGLTWPALFSARGEAGEGAPKGGAPCDAAEAAPVAVGRVWAPIDLEEEAEGEAARPMPHYEKCFQGL